MIAVDSSGNFHAVQQMSTLAVPKITKSYRLLYRLKDGTATYECVNAEEDGTELLILRSVTAPEPSYRMPDSPASLGPCCTCE